MKHPSFLKLQKSQYLPIATYKNLESDPLENIVVALSRIYPEEGAAVQIILQPTKINLEEKGEKIIEEIKQGQSFGRAVLKVEKGKTMKLFDVLSETISPSKKEKTQEDEEKKRWFQEMNLRENQVLVDAIKSKIYQPAFEVNIRLIGVAKEEWRAKEILHYLESAFLHFTSNFNGFEPARVQRRRKKEKFVYNFSFRNFSPKERIILNLEEIASIYPSDKIKSPIHLSIGQEAVAVGVCEALRQDDVVFGTYRGHALYLAKGGDLKKMIAELYGKITGCAKNR